MTSNPLDYTRRALSHLRRADPILARIIGEVGAYRPTIRRERFQALVRAIIFQQLAGAAAQAIYRRFVELFPPGRFPSPQQVLEMPVELVRLDGARVFAPPTLNMDVDLREWITFAHASEEDGLVFVDSPLKGGLHD